MHMAGSSSPNRAVQAYLAWNAHDAGAVRATFEDGGTYVDPTLPGPLAGEAIEMYVNGLIAAFPDLRFEVGSIRPDGDRVFAEWRMQGTNTGPLPGAPSPPVGRATCPAST
jgi:predicted ester cyclase